MLRTDPDIKGQSTPLRSVPRYPSAATRVSLSGLILAVGLYNYQTLKSVAPQDEVS